MLPGEVPLPLPVQNEIPVVIARPRRNQPNNRRVNNRIIVRLPLRNNEPAMMQPVWLVDAAPAEPERNAESRCLSNERLHHRIGDDRAMMHITVPSQLAASVRGAILN